MTKDAGELDRNTSNGTNEAAAPGDEAASVVNRMQSMFRNNNASVNSVSFEEDSTETATVEDASSSVANGSTATANCCINFKSGQFKMYLCKHAQSTNHECTFALCPACYDGKNMNSQSGRRATNSVYGRGNKRARTDRDPNECNHDDLLSFKTCDTRSDFSATHMDKTGVKMCVECRKNIPPQ